MTPDAWVSQSTPKAPKADAPMKRLTVDISEDLHARIKVDCATKRQNMADALRAVLERNWPADKEEAA